MNQQPATSEEAVSQFERVKQLFEEMRQSRSRTEDFVNDFLTGLDRLRRDIVYQELKWREPSAPAGGGLAADSEENRQLAQRLAEAQMQLETLESQLRNEQDSPQGEAAGALDEETRQLIDDLINERDALQHDLDQLRRRKPA